MPEEEFHTARRMFCIRNGELFIAPKKDIRSHAQWFIEEGWTDSNTADDFMKRTVRGIYYSHSLYFYKGSGFAFDDEMIRDVVKYVSVLVKELGLSDSTNVRLGPVDKVIDGKEYEQRTLGSISELV